MTFKTRLPELKFEIDEDTVLSVLSEWVRETYDLGQRDYNLNFIKSAIDGKYHVTATFIDKVERPKTFTQLAEESVDEQFPPFTITTPPQAAQSSTDVQNESGAAYSGIHPPEVQS